MIKNYKIEKYKSIRFIEDYHENQINKITLLSLKNHLSKIKKDIDILMRYTTDKSDHLHQTILLKLIKEYYDTTNKINDIIRNDKTPKKRDKELIF